MSKIGSKLKGLSFFVIGVVVGTLFFGGVALAVSDQYSLSLFKAKLVFNGVEKQASSTPFMYDNGQTLVPNSLTYNGTTYVPLRFFSEALNLPVKYDGKTKSIYVGKVPDDGVASYMSDILSPYYKTVDTGINKQMNIASKYYYKGYQFYVRTYIENSCSFNLDGKYKNITGKVGANVEGADGVTIDIYGDDKLLYSTIIHASDVAPADVNIDVTGVVKLDYRLNTQLSGYVDFVDFMIK